MVGVALPAVTVATDVPDVDVGIAPVGLLTGGVRVGVRDTAGVKVAVHVGVMESGVGGGQLCSLTVN